LQHVGDAVDETGFSIIVALIEQDKSCDWACDFGSCGCLQLSLFVLSTLSYTVLISLRMGYELWTAKGLLKKQFSEFISSGNRNYKC
jgi:hypothetical protein